MILSPSLAQLKKARENSRNLVGVVEQRRNPPDVVHFEVRTEMRQREER